jgi:hypothetical protein
MSSGIIATEILQTNGSEERASLWATTFVFLLENLNKQDWKSVFRALMSPMTVPNGVKNTLILSLA